MVNLRQNEFIIGFRQFSRENVSGVEELFRGNCFKISEFTAPLPMKYFEEEGIDIRVLPLEEIDGDFEK